MSDYAMYKGDELLHIGTIEEIAKAHGVLQQTIRRRIAANDSILYNACIQAQGLEA